MDARCFLVNCCAHAQAGLRFGHVALVCLIASTAVHGQVRMIPPRYGAVIVNAPRPAAVAPRFTVGTANFVVFASSNEEAEVMAQAAEKYRKDLAEYWLGSELPDWPERCPLYIHASPHFPASGETQYQLLGGSVGGWKMIAKGTHQRVLDSVLPHEITHTIFATHFGRLGKYMPRWADEGACTTVEHESEKRKHRLHLTKFLKTGRGLAFNHMFRLKDYPDDILPLYAQGHSAVQFLVDQAGPQEFVRFIGQGMRTENWSAALQDVYQYRSIGEFQVSWNRWLADGSPEDLLSYSPLLRNSANGGEVMLASNLTAEPQRSPVSPASHVSSPAAYPASKASVSWYQRRLTEVTGEAPPKYDGHPSGPVLLKTTRSTVKQTPSDAVSTDNHGPQRGIQIIDMDKHEAAMGPAESRTSTTASATPGMVPIQR